MGNPIQLLTDELRAEATRQGFALSGVTPAVAPRGFAHLQQWIAHGYAGEMRYLADRLPAYEHPSSVLDGVRSLLMLGFPYKNEPAGDALPLSGRIARYAWGTADYHDLLHDRLEALSRWLLQRIPSAQVRGVVDTAPLLEREFAQLAGLGWIGKNTLVLNRQQGSYFFLAALLTDQELAYDAAFELDHCGSCTACLDACPTQAFPQPYVLDATRCLSYLTIELKGSVHEALRPEVKDWVFGCDICQEVCPWNRRAESTAEPALLPRTGQNPLELAPLFQMTDDDFRKRFKKTPLWRPKRRGLLRSAALVLGNSGRAEAIEPLGLGLSDGEPLVREAAAWGLAQIGGPKAIGMLQARLAVESDPQIGQLVNRYLSPKDA